MKFAENTDGLSFLPSLLGKQEAQKGHSHLFWDFAGYGGQIAVRIGKWKGIKKNLRKKPHVSLELYNLEEDISETHNVANEYPDIIERIEEIMFLERTPPETKEFRFGTYQDREGLN